MRGVVCAFLAARKVLFQSKMALPTCAGTPTTAIPARTFKGPVQAMLADIEAGKVGTVIVKET